MRTWISKRDVMLFSRLHGEQAVFKIIKAEEHIRGDEMKFIISNLAMAFVAPEASISLDSLKTTKAWEDYSDTERLAHKGAIVTREPLRLAIEALQRARPFDNVVAMNASAPAAKIA